MKRIKPWPLVILTFVGIAAILATPLRTRAQNSPESYPPVDDAMIDSVIQGPTRQLLKDAMKLLPLSERENVILITSDGQIAANQFDLLYGITIEKYSIDAAGS